MRRGVNKSGDKELNDLGNSKALSFASLQSDRSNNVELVVKNEQLGDYDDPNKKLVYAHEEDGGRQIDVNQMDAQEQD